MIKKLLILTIIAPFLFLNCSKDAESDVGAISPDESDPYLIDAALCLGIYYGKPDKITSYFTGDEDVILWMEWDNVYGENTFEVRWLNPDGELELPPDKKTEDIENGRFVVWFSLQPSKPVKYGEWIAEIYLNGSFQRSYLFEVVQ